MTSDGGYRESKQTREESNIVMSLVGSDLSINIVWINRWLTGKESTKHI